MNKTTDKKPTITPEEKRRKCSLAAKKNWESKHSYARCAYRSIRVAEPLYLALQKKRGDDTWNNLLAKLAGLKPIYDDRRLKALS